MFTSLDTPRLTLRRFTPGDLPAFLAYRNDPEVARYQSWDGLDEAGAASFLRAQDGLEPGTPGTWFQFAAASKPDLGLVGDCGLHVDGDDARLGEIGFTFSRASQGRGLAAEAVRAVLGHAFEALGLHRVEAVVDCANQPAIRLLEQLGMRREGHFLQHTWFKGAWCDEYLYAMLASEWRQRAVVAPAAPES